MGDIRTYYIEVKGPADASDLNASSPLQVAVVRMDAMATMLMAPADQSGLVGLIRYLHGRGFVLLSVTCGQS